MDKRFWVVVCALLGAVIGLESIERGCYKYNDIYRSSYSICLEGDNDFTYNMLGCYTKLKGYGEYELNSDTLILKFAKDSSAFKEGYSYQRRKLDDQNNTRINFQLIPEYPEAGYDGSIMIFNADRSGGEVYAKAFEIDSTGHSSISLTDGLEKYLFYYEITPQGGYSIEIESGYEYDLSLNVEYNGYVEIHDSIKKFQIVRQEGYQGNTDMYECDCDSVYYLREVR